MRKLFAIALLAVLFCSCSKDKECTPSAELVTTFKFTANGTLYEMNGSLATNSYQGSIIKRSTSNYTGYVLNGHDFAGDNGYVIPITLGTLTATTYNSNYPNFCSEGSLGSALYFYGQTAADNSIVTITSIHDGVYADGTFSATTTKYMSTQKVIITDGVFKNVKILQ